MAYPRIRFVTSGLVLLVGALFATPALAQDTNAPTDINRVFVFGDSLSDGGAGITLVNLACKFATLNDPMCGVTRDSVSLLFATAHDPQMSYGRREWAMDRLARLFPGFRLSLPLPDAPPELMRPMRPR